MSSSKLLKWYSHARLGQCFSVYRHFLSTLFFSIAFLFSTAALAANEKVSIQQKWDHSFQFAGYYAALEKGYFKQAGLDVVLKPIDFSQDFVTQVIEGNFFNIYPWFFYRTATRV